MSDFLVNHAKENVWCTPDQDKSFIFRPARLTPHGGAFDFHRVLWDRIDLPESGYFHVYQIGQIDPRILGLSSEREEWISVADSCNKLNLIMDVYTNAGISIPRGQSYIRVTKKKNVILAVKENRAIPWDFDGEPLYFRVYTNAYFSSERKRPEVDEKTLVVSKRTTTTDQILEVQQQWLNHKDLPGACYCFNNGRVVDSITLINTKVGDTVEFVYDSSIIEIIDRPVSELDTFDSLLDEKRKYLLNSETGDVTIRYKDDLEMWLVKKDGSAFSGLMYHRNRIDAVRMLTHADYSVPVAYLAGFADEVAEWETHEELVLRIAVRRSGYKRELSDEHGRIKELYKMDSEDRKQAMLGIDSTVSTWHAAALESSAYPQLMRGYADIISEKLVEEAYGYNAIAKLLADSPLPVEVDGLQRSVALPPGLRSDATIYEYDQEGNLLGYHNHSGTANYFPRSEDCTHIEGIVGVGGKSLDYIEGDGVVVLTKPYNWSFYKSPIVDFTPTGEWVPAIKGEDYVISDDGTLVWDIDTFYWHPVAVSDRKFLNYDLIMGRHEDLIDISVNFDRLGEAGSFTSVMTLPMLQLDVWLNGRAMIEGLDYFCQWPRIVFCNNEYWDSAQDEQRITVRAYGLVGEDMKREEANDVGWIRWGEISRNARFNLRDDKAMRLVMFGRTLQRDDLVFSELPIAEGMRHELNGKPYMMHDPVIPLRGMVSKTAYELRKVSKALDVEIEDYLTLKLPEEDKESEEAIPRRYATFSPFLSKIMSDLRKGYLPKDDIRGHYNDHKVAEICQRYEHLLDYCPVKKGLDTNYVAFHPHCREGVIQADIYTYTFLERVIRLYLDEKVDMTPFVRLTPGEDIIFD